MLLAIKAVILVRAQNLDNVQNANKVISFMKDHVFCLVLMGLQPTEIQGSALPAHKGVRFVPRLDIIWILEYLTKCVLNVKQIGNLLGIPLLMGYPISGM